ncbi:MAG: hypothetical protein ABEJ07_04260 [Candidatus Nanohaloarchaea archaeon]
MDAGELPPELQGITRSSRDHGRYLSLLKNRQTDLTYEDIVSRLFGLPDVKRISACFCDDTSDTAFFRLFKYDNGIWEIDNRYDSDSFEEEETGTFGKPARKYLKQKYDFDGWTIWQFWESKE